MDELEQENKQLLTQLQAALKVVRLVAEDWFVHGEMYQQCFFCGESEPGDQYHKDDCPVLEAKKLLVQLLKAERKEE